LLQRRPQKQVNRMQGADPSAAPTRIQRTPGSSPDFESLDFDLCRNTVYKANEALKGPADALVYKAVKYSICGLIAATIAMAAFGVNFGVENIAGTKFWLTFRVMRCVNLVLHHVLENFQDLCTWMQHVLNIRNRFSCLDQSNLQRAFLVDSTLH
jgi:hypothetical protein